MHTAPERLQKRLEKVTTSSKLQPRAFLEETLLTAAEKPGL